MAVLPVAGARRDGRDIVVGAEHVRGAVHHLRHDHLRLVPHEGAHAPGRDAHALAHRAAQRGRAVGRSRRPLAPAARAPLVPARDFASRKHKKFVKLAKGYRGRTNCFRIAVQRVEKAWQYAFRDRKVKKREMRKSWIRTINAGSREHGVAYNRLICGLRTADIDLNRKVLADLAMNHPEAFKAVVDKIK